MVEDGGIEYIIRWFMQKWAEMNREWAEMKREKERLSTGSRLQISEEPYVYNPPKDGRRLYIPKKLIYESHPKFTGLLKKSSKSISAEVLERTWEPPTRRWRGS